MFQTPTLRHLKKRKYVEAEDIVKKFKQHDKKFARSKKIDIQQKTQHEKYCELSLYRSVDVASEPIQDYIRNVLFLEIKWLLGIYRKFSLQPQTFLLACFYNIMLYQKLGKLYDFRAISAVAILIAAKLEEVTVNISIPILLKNCSSLRHYKQETLLEAELFLLDQLEWRVSFVMTPLVYVLFLCSTRNIPLHTRQKIERILNTVCAREFLTYMSALDIGLACFLSVPENNWRSVLDDKEIRKNIKNPTHVIFLVEFILNQNTAAASRRDNIGILLNLLLAEETSAGAGSRICDVETTQT